MPFTKMNVSLDAAVAATLRRRAAEEGKTMSRYLAELIVRDARSCQEELAAEGYRLLGSQGLEFSEAARPLAAEAWPAMEMEGAPGAPPSSRAVRGRRTRARKTATR